MKVALVHIFLIQKILFEAPILDENPMHSAHGRRAISPLKELSLETEFNRRMKNVQYQPNLQYRQETQKPRHHCCPCIYLILIVLYTLLGALIFSVK